MSLGVISSVWNILMYDKCSSVLEYSNRIVTYSSLFLLKQPISTSVYIKSYIWYKHQEYNFNL